MSPELVFFSVFPVNHSFNFEIDTGSQQEPTKYTQCTQEAPGHSGKGATAGELRRHARLLQPQFPEFLSGRNMAPLTFELVQESFISERRTR